MKTLLTALSTICALLFLLSSVTYGATVIDSSGSDRECETTPPLPLESTWCSASYTSITYNNPSPAGNVLVTLNDHYIHDAGGMAALGWGYLECNGGPCSAGNVRTNMNGWGTIYGPSGGSVNPLLSAGTYNISLDAAPYDAGGVSCRWSGSPNCKIIDLTNSDGGTLTVTAAASVNLNIGLWLEEKAEKLLSLFNVEKVIAQTGVISTTTPRTAILVANINLTNTKLTKIADNDYTVSFVLTNTSEKQDSVNYRFSFVDQQGKIVSTRVYPANLTLEKNTPVFINEKLVVPEGLTGTYIVRVQALTFAGLPLGTGVAGQITLEGEKTPHLTGCTINKSGYEQNQILPVTCSIASSKPLASYVQENGGHVVKTMAFYRNEPVERTSLVAEIVNNRATAKLVGLTTPGVYTLISQLMTRGGVPVGAEIVQNFTIQGTAVSILNLLLDKDYYDKGEKAQATPSFSFFTTNQNKDFVLTANLAGNRGPCAEEFRQELRGRSASQITFDITKRCENPSLTVKVSDAKGKIVFAEKTLTLSSKKVPLSSEAKTLIAVVGLAVLFYVIRHEKILGVLRKMPEKVSTKKTKGKK